MINVKQIAKEVLQLLKQMRLKPVSFKKGNAIGFKFPLENVPGNADDDNEYGYVLISPDSISILQDYYLEELAEAKFLDMSRKLVVFMKKKYGISLPMPNRSHGLGSGVTGYMYLYADNHIRASVNKLAARYVREKRVASKTDTPVPILKQALQKPNVYNINVDRESITWSYGYPLPPMEWIHALPNYVSKCQDLLGKTLDALQKEFGVRGKTFSPARMTYFLEDGKLFCSGSSVGIKNLNIPSLLTEDGGDVRPFEKELKQIFTKLGWDIKNIHIRL